MISSFQNLLCFSVWYVTMICDWCVMVWQWYHINPNPKSPKIKIKEKEITNKKRKTKIVRVHHLELWQKCSIENRMEERIEWYNEIKGLKVVLYR